MLSLGDADRVAARFGLGSDAVMSGPVARGELGQVWCIATDRGRWAVKERFDAPSRDEAADDATYQEAVRAAGVPTGCARIGTDQVLRDRASRDRGRARRDRPR